MYNDYYGSNSYNSYNSSSGDYGGRSYDYSSPSRDNQYYNDHDNSSSYNDNRNDNYNSRYTYDDDYDGGATKSYNNYRRSENGYSRNNKRTNNRGKDRIESSYTTSYYDKEIRSPSTSNYVYSLNLEGGKKYIGRTQNLAKRLDDHFEGNGAKWTQKHRPVSVNHIQKCKSFQSSKKAETIVYYNMKDYHGSDRVRGAGNTKSF